MEGGWIDHAARSERNNGAIESCTDSASKPQSALEADREKVSDTFSWPSGIALLEDLFQHEIYASVGER
jgi:hypothetical protein